MIDPSSGDSSLPYKKRPSRWFGKVCEKHPDLNGLRAPSGVCVRCNSERVVRYHQTLRGEAKPSRACRARDRLKRIRIKGWNNIDREIIASIYQLAQVYRGCGLDVEVDHIFPLNGELVTGLHVSANLQVILAEDNQRKSNHVST